MRKNIVLLLLIVLFTLTSCDIPEDDLTIQLLANVTYFLGLNNNLTDEQFSTVTGIASITTVDESIEITIDDNMSIRSTSLANGSRGGFAIGGFTPAILFTEDSDDDTEQFTIEELNDIPQIENAREADGKIILTIGSNEEFEYRMAASGSRGGFAVGGFTPAIVFTGETDDDMDQESFASLEKVDQVFINPDDSLTLLLDSTIHYKTMLTSSGSRGGFAVGGFTPAILWTDEEEDEPFDTLDDLIGMSAIRTAALNDNNQLKIVVEEGVNFRFSASGSRGGFAVGGFTPAIVFTGETDSDDHTQESELIFKDHPAIKSYEINDDGSSTVVVSKDHQDELINLLYTELTTFLDDMKTHEYNMEYTEIIYDEDLSTIEFIVDEEFITRHDLHNDYYTNMYQTLEHYQYLFHLFSENEISYQFVVKHENKIFYNNTLYESNTNETSKTND